MTDRYTSGEYHAANRTWHAEDGPWKAEQVARMMKARAIQPRSICDIGCGSGDVLKHLSVALSGSRCVGYEMSPQALAMAERHAGGNLEFRNGSPEDGERYDLALAIDVFEHVEDYIGFIRKLSTYADSLIFHIPLDLSVQSVLRASPLAKVRRSVGHLHYFSKETALATLEHAGLRIEHWFYTAGHANTVRRGASLKTTLAAMPRSALFRLSPDLGARLLGGYSLLALCSARQSLLCHAVNS